jgi:C-terminal peptidase prc
MRFGSACWIGLFAAVGPLCAVPVVPPEGAKTAASPEQALRAEALNYARHLAVYVERIEEAYVRPLKGEDMYVAALEGLYEGVRMPVPAGLRAEVREGLKTDLVGTLARIREGLGQNDALRHPNALYISLRALPRAMDPYCGLTARFEFQRLDVNDGTLNTGLEFVGVQLTQVGPAVGTRLDMNGIVPAAQPAPDVTGPLRVRSVNPGSPAQRAGLRPGDLIVRLDDHLPGFPGFLATFQKLRPTQAGATSGGPPVKITVRRPGRDEPFDVRVDLALYHTESVFGARRKADGSWDFMLDAAEGIGYVALGGIRAGSPEEMRNALRSLEAARIRGLLLDLRWCPGGLLDEAIMIVRLFLPEQLPSTKPIFWQCDRDGKQTPMTRPMLRELLEGSFTEFPLLVLVNGETSGGGELIAAALQDHGRGAVAGQRTVGKASIQKEAPKVDIPFKVTIHTFLRSTRKNLQRFPDSKWSDDWGVRPDEGRALALTSEAGQQVKKWWVAQMLRPPRDPEALPLDDPENDPQKLACVQMLREMIKK